MCPLIFLIIFIGFSISVDVFFSFNYYIIITTYLNKQYLALFFFIEDYLLKLTEL